MIFLIASIIVSTLFGISFKVISIKKINSFQTIIINYLVAGSLGFTVVNTTWDNGYYQDNSYHTINPLFLDLHVGAEYHLSRKVGLFLDLSTGVSTIGLAFH